MSDTIYNFVSYKINLLAKGDPSSRAACARLRRAIGKPPGATPDIWDFTLQGAPSEWDSREGIPSYQEWAVHTALTLYALHQQGKERSMNVKDISFGTAIGKLVQKDSSRMEAIRRRFNAVATAMDFSELAHHARGLIQLLKSEDVTMDYPQFAKDLFYFQFPDSADRIRLRWAEDFYRVAKKEKPLEDFKINEKMEGIDEK